MRTLVTFLGRVRKKAGGEYERAKYRFPDGIRETEYIGLELARYLRPDRLLILGTSGSQWESLLSHEGTEETLQMAVRLEEAIQDGSIGQPILDEAAPLISGRLGCEVTLRLIPFGRDEGEQLEILRIIERAVRDGEVHFDVTHAFRHLSMIAFTSAFLLSRIRRIRVCGLWYGALDMREADGVAPLVELKGLLKVESWAEALVRYDATGDYGVFASLLEEDQFDRNAVTALREAAFLERISDVRGASDSLRSVLAPLGQPLSGAGELFREPLRRRLEWASHRKLDDQQKHLAWAYCERDDYLRAAIFSVEACYSHACLIEGVDPARRSSRNGLREEDLNSRRMSRLMSESCLRSYQELRRLRNCLAHGFTKEDEHLREQVDSKKEMRAWLRQRLQEVLGGANGRWPW
ncbi:MAG: TIGR02221 family CRISPR-associated protein [Bryobacteraceae bacterium]|nr:TIGR02221 family CRISPR-associated protein [Bryobacteraceae bacterium]